jgi:O-antigen/teichoic acid export membrane protein
MVSATSYVAADRLVSRTLLARNALWNLAGNGLPLAVGAIAIPFLIAGLGLERFGLLTLVWAGIGYFSLFDFGFSRALTKLTADRIARGEVESIRSLLRVALGVTLLIGACSAVLLVVLAPWLASDVLNVASALTAEAALAIRILALTIPLVVCSTALIGFLEAFQQFGWINKVRIPLGMASFLAPLAALQNGPSLVAITLALSLARLVSLLAYAQGVRHVLRRLPAPRLPARPLLGELLRFGSWVTVSNVVGPLMVYFDRFVIGAMITMSAVAFYATPFEVLSRLMVFPHALVAVLFPAVATAAALDAARLPPIFRGGVRLIWSGMFPVCALLVLLAPELLEWWLGPDFRAQSSILVRILAVGILLNSLARVPHTFLQAQGRPDLTAKLHLAELLPYFALLWWAIDAYGLRGAAAAWTLRIAVDLLLLCRMSARSFPVVRAQCRAALALAGGSALLLVAVCALPALWMRAAAALALIAFAGWIGWRSLRQLGLRGRSDPQAALLVRPA